MPLFVNLGNKSVCDKVGKSWCIPCTTGLLFYCSLTYSAFVLDLLSHMQALSVCYFGLCLYEDDVIDVPRLWITDRRYVFTYNRIDRLIPLEMAAGKKQTVKQNLCGYKEN